METRHEAFLRATGGQIERRVIVAEVRAGAGDSGNKLIVGHGAVFNQEAEIWDGIYEVVRAGAFLNTIQTADVRALKNHNPNYILGRNRAGTLRLSEDDTGLRYEIDVPDISYANDLYVSLQRGDISQSSYAFLPVRETWSRRGDGTELRELHEVELFDVSPVTYPAFVGADAQARSALAASGIDPDGLARLFLKHQRGTPFTSGERAMLRAAIKALGAMDATTEEGQRSDPDGTPTVSAGALRLRRARLALALRAI
jgi:Escherichia/Staphylococcus phage prohead protease